MMKSVCILVLLLASCNGGVLLQDNIVDLIKAVLANTEPSFINIHRDKRSTWDQETNLDIIGYHHKIKYVDTEDLRKGFKQEFFIKDVSKIIPDLPIKSIKLVTNAVEGPKHNDGFDDVYDITADYVIELLNGKQKSGSFKVYRNFEDSFYNFNVEFELEQEFMNETECESEECRHFLRQQSKNNYTIKLELASNYKSETKLRLLHDGFEQSQVEYTLSWKYDKQTETLKLELEGEGAFVCIEGVYDEDTGRIDLVVDLLGEKFQGYIDIGKNNSDYVFYLEKEIKKLWGIPVDYVKFVVSSTETTSTLTFDITFLGGGPRETGSFTISESTTESVPAVHSKQLEFSAQSKDKSKFVLKLGFMYDMKSFIKYFFYFDDFVNAAKDYSLTFKEEIIEELVDFKQTIQGEFKDDNTNAFKIEYNKADEKIEFSVTSNSGSTISGYADLDFNEDEVMVRLHLYFERVEIKYDFELKSRWNLSEAVFKFFHNNNNFFSIKHSMLIDSDGSAMIDNRWSGLSYGDGKIKTDLNVRDGQFKLRFLPKFGTTYQAMTTKDNLGNTNFEIISNDDQRKQNQEAIITYNNRSKVYIRIGKNFYKELSEYATILNYDSPAKNNSYLEYNAEWNKDEIKVTSNDTIILNIKNVDDYLATVELNLNEWGLGDAFMKIGMKVCEVFDNTTELKFTIVDRNDTRDDYKLRWQTTGSHLNNNVKLLMRNDELIVKLKWDVRGLCVVKNAGDDACRDECFIGVYFALSNVWGGVQYDCLKGFRRM